MRITYQLEGLGLFKGEKIALSPSALKINHHEPTNVYYIHDDNQTFFETHDRDIAWATYMALKMIGSSDFIKVIPGVGRIINTDYRRPDLIILGEEQEALEEIEGLTI